MKFKTLAIFLFALLPAWVLAAASEPLQVEGAWARAIVKGQGGTGAFMVFTAREPLTLVGAESTAAGIIEIHQMKLEGDVMKMRAVESLPLRAGEAVAFHPGGYHFMLMDLKAGFQAGSRIPLTVQYRDQKGKQRSVKLTLPVAMTAPAAAPRKP